SCTPACSIRTSRSWRSPSRPPSSSSACGWCSTNRNREVTVARIYVSYRSSEEPFIRNVVAQLAPSHDIRIDYNMPRGVDWRAHQLEDMRASEVFVVFVSKDTRTSDFQNAEMGSARFCQVYLDGKTLIPVLIDSVEPPRPLANLDCLDA